MTLQAGTPIGKYLVRRKLAEGGMAEIYLAYAQGPEGFEKEVVIKQIRSFLSTDPQFVQMFIAEARVASRLNHANIVQIFDFDKHEDTFYLAMEYVRGRSLWDVRRRSRQRMIPMAPTLVAHVGADVARALHHAHRLTERGRPLGLVHRDVTPHNILFSWEGAIKLTDFGIAKAGNSATAPGMLKGKFAYMSPEQARGEDVDARTDVFALGIILWEMLTGGRLFEGDSDVAVLRAVQHSAIAPPGRLNPEVPPELDEVVMKALARDREERWLTAQELERALGGFILRNATSIDDTDLGSYLRALYSDELSPEGQEHTTSGVQVPSGQPSAPAGHHTPASPSTSEREPTAVMPPRAGEAPAGRPPQAAASPDEDAHADTAVRTPPPRALTPLFPLPALRQPQAAPLRSSPHQGGGAVPGDFPADLPPPQPGGEGEVRALHPGQARSPTLPWRRSGALALLGMAALGLVAAGVTLWPTTASQPGAVLPAAFTDPQAKATVLPAEELPPAPAQVSPAGKPPAATAPGLLQLHPQAQEETVSVAPARGILVVTATPWANVFIDGQAKGDVSGRREFPVPPGRYAVRLQHPKKSLERVVTVRAGRKQFVEFDVFP